MQAAVKAGTGEIRRSGRILKEVAILLVGSDGVGKDFVEQTKTVLLSRHGAGVVSKHKLAVEQEMILVYPECGNKEIEIRIVGQLGSEDGSYTYGVAFLDPEADFWGMEFPPAKKEENSGCGMVLQCSICGCREFLNAGAVELDIYVIHEGIFRDCKRCNHPTMWQQASRGPSNVPSLPEADSALPEPTPPTELGLFHGSPEDKREHPRIRVNFTGCVRNPGREDSMVQCENVSRGGLCFKSSRRYYKTARIEVAAPYSPGSPCILVPAQIVYVQELPEEGMFRCGVQYLHLTRDPRA